MLLGRRAGISITFTGGSVVVVPRGGTRIVTRTRPAAAGVVLQPAHWVSSVKVVVVWFFVQARTVKSAAGTFWFMSVNTVGTLPAGGAFSQPARL